jgi:hypothetical protein
LGSPTGQKSSKVKASYNDLFSRPLAIVGNTGSGKSYTVASLLQKATNNEMLGNNEVNAPHIFVLDINGEYAKAFPTKKDKQTRGQPDHIYLNGEEFGIPLWFFNSQEICAWLSASEQTQEPVLKDWWSIAKSRYNSVNTETTDNTLRHALTKIENLITCLDANQPVKKAICSLFNIAKSYWGTKTIDGASDLESLLSPYQPQVNASGNAIDWNKPHNERQIRV